VTHPVTTNQSDDVPSVSATDGLARGSFRDRRALLAEFALAAAVFAALCVVVLAIAPQSAEPDDGAYHASIVAMTDGHFLTLSTTQAEALAAKLDDNPAAPPNQWVQLPDRRYISEKDPGYPFLAAPFEAIGIIRWAPLLFGALACVGLFFGARRWLGRFGGLAAVGLFSSSGAAMAFAWRDYMPTFTDASLIAAGLGALVWTVLATDATQRRRTLTGLVGFTAIELATFTRYTDIVVLACTLVAVLVAWRQPAANIPRRAVGCWLVSVAVFVVGLATFNYVVYGGVLRSGYQPGEVKFALGAIGPNLRLVPTQLFESMPMLVLGLISIGGILALAIRQRRACGEMTAVVRRDLGVVTASALCWFSVWGLYLTYTWTTDPTNAAVSNVRFYAPALGPIALVGAWLVTRIPGRAHRRAPIAALCIAALFGLGVWSFHVMYAGLDVPLHGV
jgi:hypothetical protein